MPHRIRPKDLRGFRLFEPIRGLLERLHSIKAHPNRQLHFDQYVALLLLYFLNPAVKSLRALQAASALEYTQDTWNIPRVSLGSLSEAGQVFDPQPLREIFLELAGQIPSGPLPPPMPQDPAQAIRAIAADATLLEFLPRMAPAFWKNGPRTGPPPGIKLLAQLNVATGAPIDVAFLDGYGSESETLRAHLRPQVLYLVDGAYRNFQLLQDIIDQGSSFLLRLRDDTVIQYLEKQPLGQADLDAGVWEDARVRVGSAPHAPKLKQSLRLIRARVLLPAPHNLNPRRKGDRARGRGGTAFDVVLLTDRFDLPASLLVTLYRGRWHVEIFFRWLKCLMGCKHLLSESPNGIQLQIYAALIAGLLIYLWTGQKPKQRSLEMIMHFLSGWATLDELMRYLKQEQEKQALARLKQKR